MRRACLKRTTNATFVTYRNCIKTLVALNTYFYFAIATQNCHVKNNCHVKHIQVPSNLLHTNLLCPINTPKFSCKTALKHPERLKRIRDSIKSSFFTIILRKSCVLRIVIYAVLFCFKKFYARAGLLPFVIGFKNFGLLFLAERSTSRTTIQQNVFYGVYGNAYSILPLIFKNRIIFICTSFNSS